MNKTKDIYALISCVEKFHNSFGISNNYEPTVQLSQKDIQLRFDLLREENEEYINAAKTGDMIEVADALGDLMYILFGTIMKHGMQHKIVEVFEEIQRSNMSKLGKDGKPIFREDGKVLKGPNYFKPNIQAILNQ
tara:strand:+ start:1051 stop:1455 length:405 start_codon:yes stop_codon:yes gene_type:complete